MTKFLRTIWKIIKMTLSPMPGFEGLLSEIKNSVAETSNQKLDAAEEKAQKEGTTKDLQQEIGRLLR